MVRIAIIIGSTRKGRRGDTIGRWVYELAQTHTDTEFELVDIKDFQLPFLGEASAPKAWSEKIASFDGYIILAPEYNHGPPAALKNAIDHLYDEWTNKAAGFVGYGGAGGRLAVEQLRSVMTEMQVANVRAQVSLSIVSDFEHYTTFKPRDYQEASVHTLINQVVAWSNALKTLRNQPQLTTP